MNILETRCSQEHPADSAHTHHMRHNVVPVRKPEHLGSDVLVVPLRKGQVAYARATKGIHARYRQLAHYYEVGCAQYGQRCTQRVPRNVYAVVAVQLVQPLRRRICCKSELIARPYTLAVFTMAVFVAAICLKRSILCCIQ